MNVTARLVSNNLDRLAGIAVVYTDMDGTMLGARGSFIHDPDGAPTLEPATALLAATGAGIDVVPVSGRALRGLQTDARILGLQTVIAEMGSLISYDFGQTVVQNFGETPREGMPAAIMEEDGAVVLLLKEFDGKLEHHLPWATWRECTQLLRGLVDPRAADEVLEKKGLGWLRLHDNGRLHGEYLGIPKGSARAYHLQPKGVSKGTAVALDRARRGFAREACVAIGDSFADLELAPEVGAFIIVCDALDDDPALFEAIETLDNVLVTDRAQNLGWSDVLRAVVERV
ncbi:MAG: HAD-IIB family hydrolase [Actinomycetota bacterium]|nr:HAD-IIB family hydrolase [Actinomycetota bacterium]